MSKIVIGESADGKPVKIDLDILISTRMLMQANSGGGKSWALRRLIEQCYGKVQQIIIDPEGEFSTLREKFGFVLVGNGGETPADVRSAGLVAEKLLELNASAVCDIYELKAAQRHAWVRAFLDAMINAPKRLWHPCLVIVDEAHVFCPEKGQGESEAIGAMTDLCTRGRKRGFCAVFATQRLGKLSKNASAELQNRMIGPTFEDIDRKRAADLLGVTRHDEREFSGQIQLLEPGNFFALGRAIAMERIRVRVGDVQTSHPQAGSKVTAPPPAPDSIAKLLPQLSDLPKVAEEKARTEADLRQEIRQLQTALKNAPKAVAIAPVPSNAVTNKQIKQLRATLGEAMKIILQINAKGFDAVDQTDIAKALERAGAEITKLAERAVAHRRQEFEKLQTSSQQLAARIEKLLSEDIDLSVVVERKAPEIVTREAAKLPRSAPPKIAVDGVSPAQSRILRALAEFNAIGITQLSKTWLAARAGASYKSSSFANNLGSLRSAGLIDYRSGDVLLTSDGIAAAGPSNTPLTVDEMATSCRNLLSPAQQRIFNVLYEVFPQSRTREDLADAAGASVTSSSFANNLGSLRSAGMIDYEQGGRVKMQKWIFLEGAA